MEEQSRPPPDLVAAVFHAIEFLGFLWAIGALVVRRLAGLAPRLDWAVRPLWLPIGAAIGGAVGLVIAGLPGDPVIGAVHLLSAGIWAGGIMVMGFLRPPGGWRGPQGRELVERFARVALIAFGITALTGVIQATDRLHDVSDLWTTGYGAVLGLKIAGVLTMSLLSLAWRRGLPTARFDAVAAMIVVVLTAILAAFPS